MLELFFKYLDELIVFWMDDLVIYSQTKEEHLKHLDLVCEKFRKADITQRMSKCKLLRKKKEYIRYLVSGQGISPWNRKLRQWLIWSLQQTLLKPDIYLD